MLGARTENVSAGNAAERASEAATCKAAESGLFTNPQESRSSHLGQLADGREAGASSVSPICKAYSDGFSKALWGLDELHRKHSVASNFFLCFIGSRVKTFIYFYGTHGLGDFFIMKNKILE